MQHACSTSHTLFNQSFAQNQPKGFLLFFFQHQPVTSSMSQRLGFGSDRRGGEVDECNGRPSSQTVDVPFPILWRPSFLRAEFGCDTCRKLRTSLLVGVACDRTIDKRVLRHMLSVFFRTPLARLQFLPSRPVENCSHLSGTSETRCDGRADCCDML